MKKNILFIIESSETGGAENVFAELVQRIDRERYVPHVALLYEGWLVDRLKSDGIIPHMIPTGKGGFDFRMLIGISNLVKQCDIHMIHSHLFTTNVYASVIGALFGIPVISTFHGTMDINMGDRFKWLKWQAINKLSSKIIFVSQYLKDYFVLNNLAKKTKSQVIYNGINIARFRCSTSKVDARKGLGIPNSSFVVGCVGDLRPAKDYASALRAVSLLKQARPDIRLVIAGTKTELLYELEALCNTLGIAELAEFIGYRPDIQNVFPAFDVYLSSSVSEGFSLTVVEAMAAGLPVVATRSGGPIEIIRDGETGLLVDSGSPEKIAAAIEAIYRDPNLAVILSRAGKCVAESEFSVQVMVSAYQTLYSELFGEGNLAICDLSH